MKINTLSHDTAVLVVSLPVVRHWPIHPRLWTNKGQVPQKADRGSLGLKDLLIRGLF